MVSRSKFVLSRLTLLRFPVARPCPKSVERLPSALVAGGRVGLDSKWARRGSNPGPMD